MQFRKICPIEDSTATTKSMRTFRHSRKPSGLLNNMTPCNAQCAQQYLHKIDTVLAACHRPPQRPDKIRADHQAMSVHTHDDTHNHANYSNPRRCNSFSGEGLLPGQSQTVRRLDVNVTSLAIFCCNLSPSGCSVFSIVIIFHC
jgi:hypothetical protein